MGDSFLLLLLLLLVVQQHRLVHYLLRLRVSVVATYRHHHPWLGLLQ
jgi:hypothetical protein